MSVDPKSTHIGRGAAAEGSQAQARSAAAPGPSAKSVQALEERHKSVLFLSPYQGSNPFSHAIQARRRFAPAPGYLLSPLCGSFRKPISFIALLVAVVLTICTSALAQKPKKLPSAEKVIDSYVKAIGGRKAVSTTRNATYEFVIQLNDQPFGTARLFRKAPASERWEMTFGNGQIIAATNSGSAWEKGLDSQMRTLTGAEAATVKLRAILDASRLTDIKKLNVLSKVLSVGDVGSDPAYIVEFSTRSGARLQYYFSIKTGLINKITDDVKKTRTIFDDYRPQKGILEPHRIRMNIGSGDIVLLLKSVSYDGGLSDSQFDPPSAEEQLDIVTLMREVGKNQEEIERRVSEYAFRQKETDREINSKGEIKKQTVKVYEVFPIANREPVLKLISENGIELAEERAAREEKRVQDALVKAEREREKDERDAAQKKEQDASAKKEDPAVSQFLRACEFVSPRREKFAGRDAIVFDFRPRPNFRPLTRAESLIAKLIGVLWIDPIDKQVIRLEARLAEGFKIAGGLLISLRPGAALVIEQTRMVEGVWLPRFAQVNFSVKILLFGGGDMNKTIEFSDYRHFSGDVKGYKLDAPKTDAELKKP